MIEEQLSGTAGAALAFLAEVSGKSLLVLLVASAIVFIYRRGTAADRHRVWFVALSGVILFPVLALLLPSWEAFTAPAWYRGLNPGTEVVLSSPGTESTKSEDTEGLAGSGLMGNTTRPDGSARDSSDRAAVEESNVQPTTPLASSDNRTISGLARFGSYVSSLHWTSIAFWVWLTGVLLVLGHLTTGAIGVLLIARKSVPIRDEAWMDLAEEIGDRLFITREIRLLQCPGTTMPMTWGGINPIVLLPSDASDWSEERRRLVLTHEFAHIKRWDTATQGIAQLACAVYWFNPFVWIAARKLRIEREKACDDQVISAGTVPSNYAQHLLDIASTMKTSHFQPLGAVAMARPSQLEGRVLSILDRKVDRRSSGLASRVTLAGLFAALVLPLAAMSPKVADTTPEMSGIESPASQAPSETAELETDQLPELESEGTPSPVQRQIVPAQSDTIEHRTRLIQAFISALDDEDAQIRQNAVRMLGEMESSASIAALSRVLSEDADPDVRSSAAWSLGQIEDEDAVGALSDAIEDSDADVRRMATWALGQIESVEAVPGLRRALDDPDANVRRSVVWALGQIEDPGTLDALVDAASDDDREVRKSAVWAMGQLEDSGAIPTLSNALKDMDPEVRSQAAWALGQIEDAAAVDVLVDALDDDNTEVRKNAAWALSQIEDPRAIPGLLRVLNSGDASQKQVVLNSLSDFETPEVMRAIVGATSDKDETIRAIAVRSLREFENQESILALKKALMEDSSPLVKQSAAAALADIETDAALDALDEALGAEDPAIKEAVMRSLRGYPSMR